MELSTEEKARIFAEEQQRIAAEERYRDQVRQQLRENPPAGPSVASSPQPAPVSPAPLPSAPPRRARRINWPLVIFLGLMGGLIVALIIPGGLRRIAETLQLLRESESLTQTITVPALSSITLSLPGTRSRELTADFSISGGDADLRIDLVRKATNGISESLGMVHSNGRIRHTLLPQDYVLVLNNTHSVLTRKIVRVDLKLTY